MADLRTLISQATTTAMKARDKPRLAALRLVNAALKQVEVDERKELSDDDVIAVLNRMLKQRRDSESQFRDAGRTDLAEVEAFEIALIGEFMPEPLDDAAIDALIVAQSPAAARNPCATWARSWARYVVRCRVAPTWPRSAPR